MNKNQQSNAFNEFCCIYSHAVLTRNMWRKCGWVAKRLDINRVTVKRWSNQGRFNKTLTTPRGQTEYWSVTDDGSDLLRAEPIDLSEPTSPNQNESSN